MARLHPFPNDASLILVVLVLIPCMITSCPAAEPSKWLLHIAASDATLSVDTTKDSKKDSPSFLVQQTTALPVGMGTNNETDSTFVVGSSLAVGAIPAARSISLARKNRR